MAGIDYRDAATGLRIVEEPYPNGVRARAVYRGDERIYHGPDARTFVSGVSDREEGADRGATGGSAHPGPARTGSGADAHWRNEGRTPRTWRCAIEAIRNPKRCTLCACHATGEVFGFVVCEYHVDHTEDDPPCPKCEAYAERDKR